MAHKSYHIVLVLTRVLALGFVVYWSYIFFMAVMPSENHIGGEFAKMAEYARGQAMAASGKSMLAGLALYFLAPYVAWAATQGIKDKTAGGYDDYF